MIKPDLIVKQPFDVDYPMWRHFLRTHRHYYDKVIVSLTDRKRKGGPNIVPWLRQELAQDRVTFTEQPVQISWDHDGIHAGLKVSSSEYFALMHQDFLIYDDKVIPAVLSCSEDLIGYRDHIHVAGERFNFAFAIIRRSCFNKTSQLIYPRKGPDGLMRDSGGVVSLELEELGSTKEMDDIEGLYRRNECHPKGNFYHLTGLTFRYSLMYCGQQEEQRILPLPGQWAEFGDYNRVCLTLPIAQCPDFLPYIQDSARRHTNDRSIQT